jgi:Tfp pilus assembly protein PilX
MFLSFRKLSHPSTLLTSSHRRGDHSNQSGLALVVTLILLLVLMLMGSGIAYIASMQSDLVSAVANKPLSIEAGETCFDNAIDWLGTSAGKSWVNGSGLPYDLAAVSAPLAGKTVLADTIPLGQADSRSAKFKDRAGRASYSSCIVEKLASTSSLGIGSEVGTSNGYGVSTFTYTIRITAIGNYNVPLTGNVINKVFWQSNSSRTVLEAVVQYTP